MYKDNSIFRITDKQINGRLRLFKEVLYVFSSTKPEIIEIEVKDIKINMSHQIQAVVNNQSNSKSIAATSGSASEKNSSNPSKSDITTTKNNTDNTLSPPCYMIGYAATSQESAAKSIANQLKKSGYNNAGYYWIPEYDPAGKPLYRVYLGCYSLKEAANTALESVRQQNPAAYITMFK